jgi:hypothetical protein
MPQDSSEAIRAVITFIIGLLILVAIFSVIKIGPAHSRWRDEFNNNPPEVQQWFRSQRNKVGTMCCDEADGHPYYDDYKMNPDGSVTVSLNGSPHIIPNQMVLDGPNPTGHAIWWFRDTGAWHRDYCFAPGALQ